METSEQLSPSVIGAADEYVEFTCSPCKHDSKFLEDQVYCENCSEYYCRLCMEFHKKIEKMVAHRLVDMDGMKAQERRKSLSDDQLSRSAVGASDEYFTCSPCEQYSKVLEADVFCVDCSQYLCVQCLEFHNKFEKKKAHHLVVKDGMKAQDHRKPRPGQQLPCYVAGASDETFDFTCSPCEYTSKVMEAVVYCEDCSEYLCRECLELHNRLEKMKANRMLDRDRMKDRDHQKSLSDQTESCEYHERKEQLKCVLVGDTTSGKSCLISSFKDKHIRIDKIATIFDNHEVTVTTGGKTYTLGLWDTAGIDAFDRLRPLAYPQTDVFLVCFSITSPSSFENVSAKWLPEVKHHRPKVPFLFVGCKADLRDDAATTQQVAKYGEKLVSVAEAELLAGKLGAVKYVECSALTQEGVTKVFEESVLAALNPPTPVNKCLIS